MATAELTTRGGEVVTIPHALMPAMSMDQALARYKMMGEFAAKVMREGHDYGVIPGTERKPSADGTPSPKNNTLLKPGAEKLCTLFGLTPVFEVLPDSIINFETGLFSYSMNCILLRNAQRIVQDGNPIVIGDYAGSGIGNCNSREKKYARGKRTCPTCGVPGIRKSNKPPRDDPEAAPGWYCWAKEGGCGAQFAADDRDITDQPMTVDAAGAADQVNTLIKMSCKRALIAASLIATNASDYFTQDIGDDDANDDRGRGQPQAGKTNGNGHAPASKPTLTIGASPKRKDWIEAIELNLTKFKLDAGKVRQTLGVAGFDDVPVAEANDLIKRMKTAPPEWAKDATTAAPATSSIEPGHDEAGPIPPPTTKQPGDGLDRSAVPSKATGPLRANPPQFADIETLRQRAGLSEKELFEHCAKTYATKTFKRDLTAAQADALIGWLQAQPAARQAGEEG